MNSFEYTVDGEVQHTTAHDLTAGQILSNAGLKPAERYLIELKGKDQVPYKDPTTLVHLHEHAKFVSAFIGPVPVS